MPEMDDDKGTSLVFVNSEKGRRIFEAISDKMLYKEVDINEAVKYNPSAYKSVNKHSNRGKFFKRINSDDFANTVCEMINTPLFVRVVNKLKRAAKKLIVH